MKQAIEHLEYRTVLREKQHHAASFPMALGIQRHRDFAMKLHDHDFWEIALVLQGSATHYFLDAREPLEPGDVLMLRPGTWHTYEDCADFYVYNCLFPTEFLQGDIVAISGDPVLNYLFGAAPLSHNRRGLVSLHLPPSSLASCREHLDSISSVGSEMPGMRTRQMGHLLMFLSELAAHTDVPHDLGDNRMHDAVREGAKLLEQRLAHAWTLEELARPLFVDAAYLSRLFKKHLGLPPMSYLARLRAEHAARLLLRTSDSIGDIGQQVGWHDPTYFARRFREHMGMSAREYRERFAQRDASSRVASQSNQPEAQNKTPAT